MSLLKRFSAFIIDRATVRRILISLAALIVVLALMEASPIGKARLAAMAAGQGMLDMEFGYSLGLVQSMFGTLGPAGRKVYQALLGLDVVFALAYAWVQSLMMSRLMAKVGVPAPWTRVNLLPWLRSALDLAENALLFWLLESYPAIAPAIVAGACALTRAKWVVYYCDVAILLSLGIATTGKTMKSRSKINLQEAQA